MKSIFQIDVKLLIIIILSAFIFIDKCGGDEKTGETIDVNGKPHQILSRRIDTFIDYKTKIEIKKGDDIYHENYSVDTAYLSNIIPIDTANVILDYFSKRVYKDTLILNDSLGFVYLTDTLSQNKIKNRLWVASVREKTIKDITIVKDPPKVEYYIGLSANFDKVDKLNSMGLGLMIKSKKNNILQLNTGFTNKPLNATQQFVPYLGGSYFWNLK
jgi:hypothetical protein